ncbi:MAG: preprotein translocase subunit SecY [Mycoplasmataceae bacterium]|nr:preprotein translocase subunit SecY [Mycoplasmataceae bacterium]
MNTFKAIFTDWKIAKRLLITLGLILLFRWGVMIPVPGTTVTGSEFDTGSFLGIMNTLGGGGLTQFSIFALGVSPYITSSIIIQLLSSDVIPSLTNLNKQGERGRIKIEKITRLITIGIAVMQALAIILALSSSGYITIVGYNGTLGMFTLTMIMVSGSLITLWIADQITISGIGNGTSIIIMVGIVARIPTVLSGQLSYFVDSSSTAELYLLGMVNFIFYILFTLGLVWLISFFETSERRLPIQQTGQGLNLINDKQTYLPIKVNPAGIIPVIFSSAIISLPGTIAQFFDTEGAIWVTNNFALTSIFGILFYSLLLILFTFFYAHININSVDTANNFQKSSTFIIGVVPGKDTEKYISKVVTRLTVMGSLGLTFLAIMPYSLTFIGIPKSIAVGGTSMIILVSVAIDLWEQLQARVIASQTNVKQKQKIYQKENKGLEGNSETILFD